ncbi:MarR family winged helix-turn-helix transcriptional regulator [Roseomonas rosulenta]|uniref:MarR family winged helix-turn-helix transcriptional regulator n=1 Tax=Roseomonas rosulenta TaxID=2748667 RepID=UPI001E38CCC0|nr:MarR family winged helix-turn-helix transcriptional regulator [Roseomonas rosulenta]
MTSRIDPPPTQPVPAIHRRVPQYLARRLWQIANTFQSEAHAGFDLPVWNVALIAQIQTSPGMDRNWLAAAIGIDPTSTGQALAALEARGLVARSANPQDRRANAFSLTPAGHALRAEFAVQARTVSRRLLAPLTDAEAETLLDLMARLVDAHETHARPGAGRRPPRRARREEDPPCPTPSGTSGAAPPVASASASSSAAAARRRSPQPGPTARSD